MPNVNSAVPEAGLTGFNALSPAEAEAELLSCCASRAFAREVAASRPFPGFDRLAGEAEAVVRRLGWSDVREALAAHPRIGERLHPPPPAETLAGGPGASRAEPGTPATRTTRTTRTVRTTRTAMPAVPAASATPCGPAAVPGRSAREVAWSSEEQAGAGAAGQDVLTRLAEGNRAYEERFGHVYLICAADLPAEEMLARLGERLGNDEDAERDVVRAELAKITRLRLARLLAGTG